jgi:hypothetical protein|tara:strand:- start:321 stop:758 length:438 start_codon:yes stop_codon:yes gene_type:complete
MIPVKLVGKGGVEVDVDLTGAVRVAEGAFDLTQFNTLDTIDTAYNFYAPKVGRQFLITGFLCFADKDISDASDTVVEIYEATASDSTTVSKCLFQFGMGKLTVLPYPNIRVLVNPGVWINAKTGDDDIHLNIIGHYITTILDPVE